MMAFLIPIMESVFIVMVAVWINILLLILWIIYIILALPYILMFSSMLNLSKNFSYLSINIFPMLSRGIRNNNPLNIRKGGKWLGLRSEQTDPAFCQFVSVEYGFRAALICLRTYHYKYKCDTIRQIIERWAPASDGNNVESYIYNVCLNMRLFLRSSDMKVFESEINENMVVNCWITKQCPHPLIIFLLRSMSVVESCSSFSDVDFSKVVSLL